MATYSDASVLYTTSSGVISGPGEAALISGINKTAQKVMLELLTSTGSMKYQPNTGTSFLKILNSVNTYSEYDVFMAFALASALIKKNIQQVEKSTTPDSEKLYEIKLKKVAIVPDTLLLTITVTNNEKKTIDVTVGVEVKV